MRYLIPIVALLALAACVEPPKPAPMVRPTPVVVKPTPAPAPSPLPLGQSWNDWPFTSGDWNYRRDERGSIALFGATGADAMLTLRCDRMRNALYLSVQGAAGAATIRTTTLTRAIPLQSTGGDAGYVASQLATTDALLDAMIFSRGRFVVERAGQPPLVVRPFAEMGRVIEDCRG